MKRKFFSKFGIIKRRAFCGMLCLVMVFLVCTTSAFAGITNTYQGYKWTRIHNEAELRAYYEEAETDRQKRGRKLVDGTKDKDIGSEDQWFKALIAYQTNGVMYFMSGSSMCSDGEKYSASKVLPSYSMPVGTEDEFITISGYYSPYIKYAGDDPDNSKAPKFYVRFSQNDNEDLGDDVLIGNASWYGIKYHAAMYGEFHKTNNDNISTRTASAACSSTAETCFTMKWESDGTFRAFYNIHGVADRWWCYNDKNYKMEVAKSPSKDKSNFYLYLGVPYETPKIDEPISVLPGYTTTYDMAVVTESGSITIPKNATVVIQNKCTNNGEIIVDGGTLIIKGTLDTSTGVDTNTDYLAGSVRAQNGGCVYVEETGLLISRFSFSQLELKSKSTMVIAGSAVIGGSLSIEESLLTVREGAALICGLSPKEEVDATSFGRAYLKANKVDYLSNYFFTPGAGYKNHKVPGKNQTADYSTVTGLTLNSQGAISNSGLFYYNGSMVIDNASCEGTRSTNKEATIESMMSSW
ncbi:MAG: hypothetical protein Q4E99_02640 [Bacillota bacterium]|nr:hypothetical protein [Bacillota bacterium]